MYMECRAVRRTSYTEIKSNKHWFFFFNIVLTRIKIFNNIRLFQIKWTENLLILLTISDVFVRKLAQKHHVIESNGFVVGKTKSQNSDVKIGCVGFVGDKVIVLVCEPAYKLPILRGFSLFLRDYVEKPWWWYRNDLARCNELNWKYKQTWRDTTQIADTHVNRNQHWWSLTTYSQISIMELQGENLHGTSSRKLCP